MREFSIFRVIFSPVSSTLTIARVNNPDTGLIGRVLAMKLEEAEQDDIVGNEYIKEARRHATELFLKWNKTWKLGWQKVEIAGVLIGTILITEIKYHGS